jgi:hypothetical protein
MFLAGLQGAYEEMDTTVLKAQGKPYRRRHAQPRQLLAALGMTT